MQQFYEPSLLTCFKSGLMLAVLFAVPTAVYHYSASVLWTGIMAIVISSFIYNHSLSSAGLNAAMIRMSSCSAITETLIITLALFANLAVFVITANQFTFMENGFDAVRVVLATTLIAYLPFSVFAVATIIIRD